MDQEQCAKLVEAMIEQQPWKDQMWARCALFIAARAVRRGRHLTEREKLLNLADAMEEPGGDGERFPDVAAMLRAVANR